MLSLFNACPDSSVVFLVANSLILSIEKEASENAAENILASYSELHTLCNARIKSVRSSCEMGVVGFFASGVVGFFPSQSLDHFCYNE